MVSSKCISNLLVALSETFSPSKVLLCTQKFKVDTF